MKITQLKAIVEGLLFASGDEGVSLNQFSRILEVRNHTVQDIIEQLINDYKKEERGVMIMEYNGVYHLTTKPEHSQYFKKLLETPSSSRISQAALETLAIIAYQQPITRVEIEEIRGVSSDGPVRTLVGRSLVEEVGRKDTIGRPILFGTSKDFLTYFGLTSIEELPPLPENVDNKEIEQEADLFLDQFHEIDDELIKNN